MADAAAEAERRLSLRATILAYVRRPKGPRAPAGS
jgi:hypothetical protein